jgi:ABC-type protease/lipase transport system fused ATPase/permease subunit
METVLTSGANLPAGAALRVALARALLREPALLLVDDADAVAAALGGEGGGGGGGDGGGGGSARLGAAISQVLARGGTAVVVGGASVARARSLGLEASLCEEVELRDGVLVARN